MQWLFFLHSGSDHTHMLTLATPHVTRLNATIKTINHHANAAIVANATLITRKMALTMSVNAILFQREITLTLITQLEIVLLVIRLSDRVQHSC